MTPAELIAHHTPADGVIDSQLEDRLLAQWLVTGDNMGALAPLVNHDALRALWMGLQCARAATRLIPTDQDYVQRLIFQRERYLLEGTVPDWPGEIHDVARASLFGSGGPGASFYAMDSVRKAINFVMPQWHHLQSHRRFSYAAEPPRAVSEDLLAALQYFERALIGSTYKLLRVRHTDARMIDRIVYRAMRDFTVDTARWRAKHGAA